MSLKFDEKFLSVLESVDSMKKAKAVETTPVVYTKFIYTQLIEALENVMARNTILDTLIVEGLPLNGQYLVKFVKGLCSNASITSLNFARCQIDDDGCETLCNTIKHLMNVKSVNFSSCNLTAKGAAAVADLIKFQKIQRFSEAWAQSLRYRDIDPDSHSGVRKILLNGNPMIGDQGVEAIAEVLQEDAWIKDVEMQNCGLGDESAQHIINCLNLNKTILNFNVAGNPDITDHFYRHIIRSLTSSEGGNLGSTDSDASDDQMTKKELFEKLKFVTEQLEVAIVLKRKTEDLYEKLQKQFNESQKEAMIQRAVSVPDGYTLIKIEVLDKLTTT